MDITKKIRPLKATYLSLGSKHKLIIALTLVSFATFLLPHKTFAITSAAPGPDKALYFVINGHFIYLDSLNAKLTKSLEQKKMSDDLKRQIKLADEVRQYLQAQNSPLAAYSNTLIHLNNWKKIIALSNAESGLCKHYPEAKANCWGIGGANLWYLGSNLGEGIVTMNHFLNTYPARSSVKYSQMTFKQMNGLYKQPPAQHWVDNNQSIYNDLTQLEKSI